VTRVTPKSIFNGQALICYVPFGDLATFSVGLKTPKEGRSRMSFPPVKAGIIVLKYSSTFSGMQKQPNIKILFKPSGISIWIAILG